VKKKKKTYTWVAGSNLLRLITITFRLIFNVYNNIIIPLRIVNRYDMYQLMIYLYLG